MQNRVRKLRERAGLTQTELAEKLGVHWQTVQRVESGYSGLSNKKAEAYARALGVTSGEIFSDENNFRQVSVKAHVQAGEWSESNEWMDDDQYNVAIPDDPALRPYQLFGAETRGPSMDKVYPEGTSLIFTEQIETSEQIIPGKRYIVERERADGLREETVKTLWKDDDGRFWLIPESTDPRFNEPIPLNGEDGDTIRIVGRVVYSVRRE